MTDFLRLRARIADLRDRGVYAGWPNEFQAIFIHIPKTAGTSVAKLIWGGGSRHVRCQEYLQANPKKFSRFFKFTIVRNPWDRLVSSYEFLRQGGLAPADAQFAAREVIPWSDFGEFVRHGLPRPQVRSWVHLRPQTDWVCDEAMLNRMDFTGRFESLDDDFAVISARLGIPNGLPVTNRSNRSDYRIYYDDETRHIVAELYRSDIEEFGYTY